MRDVIGHLDSSHFILFCARCERFKLFEKGSDMITHMFHGDNTYIYYTDGVRIGWIPGGQPGADFHRKVEK